MANDIILEMYRGCTAIFSIAAFKRDGTTPPPPQSLTGATLYFTADFQGSYQLNPYDVKVQKTSLTNGGITIISEDGGTAVLQIEPSDTALIPDVTPGAGVFVGPCTLLMVIGSEKIPLASGTLTIKPSVPISA